MPDININGVRLHYEIEGEGPETLFFSHGLLWSGKLFDKQVSYFMERYRCVTYDHRGQGQSELSKEGFGMDQLADDAIALIEALELPPLHFTGLSMGGFVAMRVALRRPDLLKSLILMETSADPEPNKFKYNSLNLIVRLFGVSPVSGQVMPIMFGKDFLNDPTRKEEKQYWEDMLKSNKKTIVKAVQGVIDRRGVYNEISGINMPCLVIVGDQDLATVPEKSERIHQQIQNSKFVVIPGAGHSSCVEEPQLVNRAVEVFLQEIG